MKTSFITMKGLFVLTMLLLFSTVTIAQSNRKAQMFKQKGQKYYKLFQKADQLNNYPYTDKDMVVNLQKAEISFHRALALYKMNTEKFKEEINRINLYLRIIAYQFDQIKEKRKEYTTSR